VSKSNSHKHRNVNLYSSKCAFNNRLKYPTSSVRYSFYEIAIDKVLLQTLLRSKDKLTGTRWKHTSRKCTWHWWNFPKKLL